MDIDNFKKDMKNIKLIVFDVDGVLVPRGTKITQKNGITTLETKVIQKELIFLIQKLKEAGFLINISSGRGLYMLQEMFRTILPYVSLTYENGSATWYEGKIIQHFNSFEYLQDVQAELTEVEDKDLLGFEPKEMIITIHCKNRIGKIENIVKKYEQLYYLWNEEAYDIGVKELQTKGKGVEAITKYFNLESCNVLAIGDNYNDKELLENAGVKVSADKTRLKGDYYIDLEGEKLPAHILMEQILKVVP